MVSASQERSWVEELAQRIVSDKLSPAEAFAAIRQSRGDHNNPLAMTPNERDALRLGTRCFENESGGLFPDYTDARAYPILQGLQRAHEAIGQIDQLAQLRDGKPIILALFCGGTLSMVMGDNGLRPAKDGAELLASAGSNLADKAHLVVVDVPKIDSVDQCPAYVSELVGYYHYIARRMSEPAKARFGGVLLGHGTDTAATTGALIRYMHRLHEVPVVMVCAQNSADSSVPDGPGNIATSVGALLSMHKAQFADLLVHSGGGSGGTLIPMGSAQKKSDDDLHIFHERGYGAYVLGLNDLNDPHSLRRRCSSINRGDRSYISAHLPPVMLDGYSPVELISAHNSANPEEVLTQILKSDKPFIGLQSQGTATFARDMLEAIVLAQSVLDQQHKRIGTPKQQIVILTAWSDGKVGTQYESAQVGTIPVVCLTREAFLAKAMYVSALATDPKQRLQMLLGDINADAPPHVLHGHIDQQGVRIHQELLESMVVRQPESVLLERMSNKHTPPLDYAKASLEELYFEVVIGTGFGRVSDCLHNV